jgi:hypothetical protein
LATSAVLESLWVKGTFGFSNLKKSKLTFWQRLIKWISRPKYCALGWLWDSYLTQGLTYPKLRYFDQWQGHGWASGLLFGNPDGNNIESISEEINAWEGLILWGMATQRPKITELGIYLHTTYLQRYLKLRSYN